MQSSNRMAILAALIVTIIGPVAARGAFMGIGTYVDADGGSSGNTVNSGTAGPGNQTDWFTGTSVAGDGLWTLRTDLSLVGFAEGADIWEADGPESPDPVPQITTTITGLTPGETYEAYVVYVGRVGSGEYWALRAALAGNPLTVWDGTGTTGVATGPVAAGVLFQYEGDLGSAVADGSGHISVNVNQLMSHPGTDDRAWYDGVAFLQTSVPEPASASILILAGVGVISRRRHR